MDAFVRKWSIADGCAHAGHVIEMLGPFCDRIETAGSVRRGKPRVKDVEIVCIPRREAVDLFGAQQGVCSGFIATVNAWEKVKGEPLGKYTQRVLPSGMTLDLFMATPENWGVIFAIRTGSAEFSHRRLAARWAQLGYKCEGGILVHRDGMRVAVREERELFDLLGIPWVDPAEREIANV